MGILPFGQMGLVGCSVANLLQGVGARGEAAIPEGGEQAQTCESCGPRALEYFVAGGWRRGSIQAEKQYRPAHGMLPVLLYSKSEVLRYTLGMLLLILPESASSLKTCRIRLYRRA